MPNNWDNALATRSEVDTAQKVSGTRSLKVAFPMGRFGPATDTGTGIQVELFLPPASEYSMSYFLRFGEGFSWGGTSEGGKLPGLTNRKRCDADFQCDGTDGFSARFMWRKNGKGVLYLYHADMPQAYGQDFAFKNADGSDFLFQKGKWYHIAERVRDNTASTRKDGGVQVWVNGLEVLRLDTIRFQTNGDQIDNFFLSTFHGGSSAEWAPLDTSYLWIDDLAISSSLSDVSYRPCSNPDASFFGETCDPSSASRGFLRLPQGHGIRVMDLRGRDLGEATPQNLSRLSRGVVLLVDRQWGAVRTVLRLP